MIIYTPFWELLERSTESQYTLIRDMGFSRSTLNRLKHNMPLSSKTINKLCFVFDCQPGDLMQYTQDNPRDMAKIMNIAPDRVAEKQALYNAKMDSLFDDDISNNTLLKDVE